MHKGYYITDIVRATDILICDRREMSLDAGLNAIHLIRSIIGSAINAQRNGNREVAKAHLRDARSAALWLNLREPKI